MGAVWKARKSLSAQTRKERNCSHHHIGAGGRSAPLLALSLPDFTGLQGCETACPGAADLQKPGGGASAPGRIQGNDQNSGDNWDYGARRRLPVGLAARKGLSRGWGRPPVLAWGRCRPPHALAEHRGQGHARRREPCRSLLPHSHHAGRSAGRGVQSRGSVLCRRLLESARADRADNGRRRAECARGPAHCRAQGPLLSSVVLGNVRQGAGIRAERKYAVLSSLALRRREGLRALVHGELPRELRHPCVFRHPVQP